MERLVSADPLTTHPAGFDPRPTQTQMNLQYDPILQLTAGRPRVVRRRPDHTIEVLDIGLNFALVRRPTGGAAETLLQTQTAWAGEKFYPVFDRAEFDSHCK